MKLNLIQSKLLDPMTQRLLAWSQTSAVKCEARPDSGELVIMGPILDAETAELYRMFGLESAIDDRTVYEQLKKISGDEVSVLINSPGGDAFTGVSIYNLLKASGKTVNVTVTGVAASAASVIAMAGERVTMGTGATMMIHRAWACSCGNAIELRERADVLETIDENITDVYQERTGLERAKITAMLHPDTYMSADEAISMGFADEIEKSAGTERAEPTAKASAMRNFFLGLR
jgi:ATP-dependent protease ClpP protease subunit